MFARTHISSERRALPMESNNKDDANDRRRLDAEAQRNRDAEVARLRAARRR